jgi:type IV fimbrial biogenesis protein FimT
MWHRICINHWQSKFLGVKIMKKDAGFSLMELMVAIGILAILAAIAIPGLIGWRDKAQLGRAARDVYSTFQKAKIEAVRRNTPITITFRSVEEDYIVYVDADDDWTYDPGEEIAPAIPWSNYPGVSIDASQGGGDGLSFANPADGIQFTPNGFARDNTDALAGGTVYINNHSNKKISIVVSPAGNIRIN